MWGKKLSESHKIALTTSRIGKKTIYTEKAKLQMSESAKKRKGTPQEHCDEFAQNFLQTWKELEIDYDIFYRTTNIKHKEAVQELLKRL